MGQSVDGDRKLVGLMIQVNETVIAGQELRYSIRIGAGKPKLGMELRTPTFVPVTG